MGVSFESLQHGIVAMSLCKVLDEHIPQNLFILRVEHVVYPGEFRRGLRFTYAKKSESLVAKQTRREAPEYILEVGMPIWNTHVNLEQIIAKFALVG